MTFKKSQICSQTLDSLWKTNSQYFCQIIVNLESGANTFFVAMIDPGKLEHP